ncbi:phosphotransferase family protein [Olivibacter domesticus]|uniref:phosphotransferase family protein n=1 Tax=Olivibacter domesticus TaxID=407022 RepID=UPI000B866A77|nr:phosphotransferase [Olivibacter domesticus]
MQNGASLVHSDVNQKNILVHKYGWKWQVSGILDWEYAFSGSPLVDFGNFFRFEDEMPAYQKHLVAAYLEQGGVLESNWQYKARVLYLLSMTEFLHGKATIRRHLQLLKKLLKEHYSLFIIKLISQ